MVMPVERKRQQDVFRLGAQVGPYDEMPLLPPDVDPQITLSRNDRAQPFFLICQQDTVLAQLAGEAIVEFKLSSVNYHTAGPGDYVYVPAGTPHRITPRTESLQLRYKARDAGLEGAAWYCPRCSTELWRFEWDTARELPQEGYARACAQFNADAALRRCRACDAEHPPVDLAGLRWTELAASLRAQAAAAPAPPATPASAAAPPPARS